MSATGLLYLFCYRYIVQNAGHLCISLCGALSRSPLPLPLVLQLRHEAILYRQQLLHSLPHALSL